MSRAAAGAGVVLAAGALGLAGCGDTVDPDSVERALVRYYGTGLGGPEAHAHCPGGKRAKKGTRFRCTVRLGHSSVDVEVTMTTDTKFTFRTG